MITVALWQDRVESFFLASHAHEVLMQRWRDTLFQIAQMNENHGPFSLMICR